jgi:TAT (twin-arginine translocation) pathway signal sequence
MTYEPSRRHFLRSAAVGAAVVGVASASPQLLTGPAAASTRSSSHDGAPQAPVTAFVRDHRTGEVAVMVGEHQVIHHDHALASKLAHIASLDK